MTVGEILKHKDIDTYRRLKNMFKQEEYTVDFIARAFQIPSQLLEKEIESNKKIKLGCSVEELMKSDSYCREGRRIKQRSWG